jgi:hypothetical protein
MFHRMNILGARLTGFPFQRSHERCGFTANKRSRTFADLNIEIKVCVENVFA